MNSSRPFSLVRRIILLVVGVSIVTSLLHSALLIFFVKPLSDELLLRVASQVRSVAAALESVPAVQRDELAAALSRDGITVSRTRPTPASHRFNELEEVPPALLEMLDDKVGRGARSKVTAGRDGRSNLGVSVHVVKEIWWVSFSNALPPFIVWPLLSTMTAIGIVATAAIVALIIGVRLITRPMSELARDMLARRQGLSRIAEPAHVSMELQQVIQSFNALVHAVELSAQSHHNLLAGVSHDLRTPLARMRLRAETECSEEIAGRMEVDILAMSRIIDQFLAYVQAQSGMTIIDMQPVGDLAQELVNVYRSEGADVGLIQHGNTRLRVPNLGMQRSLVNLIDNARTHGSGPIQVELWGRDLEIEVIVYDHGRGIAECDLGRALQPFVRLDPTPSQTGQCGLGLAIVAEIVEQLGGRTILKPYDGLRAGVGVVIPVERRIDAAILGSFALTKDGRPGPRSARQGQNARL